MQPCIRGRRARGAAYRRQAGGLPRGLSGRLARTGSALVLQALPLTAFPLPGARGTREWQQHQQHFGLTAVA